MTSTNLGGWRKNRPEFSKRGRRPGRWARRPMRPSVEALEDRTSPAITNVVATSLPTVVSSAGSALAFNGTSDYLVTPNLQGSFATTSVTVELWFKANAPGVILDELGSTAVDSAPGTIASSRS